MTKSWSRGVFAAAIAMATMVSASHAGEAASPAAAHRSADDTGRNVRDGDGETLTADKQSNDGRDVELTRQVRQAIVKNGKLSTNAHNVKIITNDGVVTLRGPVASAEEKRIVAKMAEKIDGVDKVDDQLEIAKP